MSEGIKADKLSSFQFEMCISYEIPKHFRCVQEGAVITIDYDGIWCTKDEPKPKKEKCTCAACNYPIRNPSKDNKIYEVCNEKT